MSDSKKKVGSTPPQTGVSQKNSGVDRRAVLKGLTIGGAALTADKWSRPIVEAITLPAHAQTSIRAQGSAVTTTATIIIS